MALLPAAIFVLLAATAFWSLSCVNGQREERVLVLGTNHESMGSHFSLASHLVRILAAEPRVAYVVCSLM
jgi:predicted class III extradiol MEMO1 family dioxygenase